MNPGMYSIACKRALGSLLLALLFVLTLAPAFSAANGACATNCCRNKKACSCRKNTAPNTISATTCPAACCRLNTIPTFAFAAAIPFLITTPLPLVSAALRLLQLSPLVALLCFALSQRPPPPTRLPAR